MDGRRSKAWGRGAWGLALVLGVLAWAGSAAYGQAGRGPAVRWVGQDGKDFVGPHNRMEPSDVQDVHIAIAGLEVVISAADRALAWTEALSNYVKCSVGTSTDCPTAMVSAATYSVVAGITNGIALASEATIAGLLELRTREEVQRLRGVAI